MRVQVSRWLPPDSDDLGRPADPPPVGSFGQAAPPAILELGPLTALVGEDRVAIGRYLDLFTSTTADLLGDIGSGVRRRELDVVHRLAHTLKGACGNVGAEEMAALALSLETAVLGEQWDTAGRLCLELNDCFARTRVVAGSLR